MVLLTPTLSLSQKKSLKQTYPLDPGIADA